MASLSLSRLVSSCRLPLISSAYPKHRIPTLPSRPLFLQRPIIPSSPLRCLYSSTPTDNNNEIHSLPSPSSSSSSSTNTNDNSILKELKFKPDGTATTSFKLPPHLQQQHEDTQQQQEQQKPTYSLTFTCTVCKTRSSHNVSHQAYHKGTVLISCPGCKNRHLMADHLGVFGQKGVTLDDIMGKLGEKVQKGWKNGEDIELVPEADEEEEEGDVAEEVDRGEKRV